MEERQGLAVPLSALWVGWGNQDEAVFGRRPGGQELGLRYGQGRNWGFDSMTGYPGGENEN